MVLAETCEMMRILVHDYSGHPFQVELSRWLAAQGHVVHHIYCASFETPHGALDRRTADPPTFSASSISTGATLPKAAFGRRALADRKYGSLIASAARAFRPEVVISANAPLDAQASLLAWAKKHDVPFIYWLQDVYSQGIARVLSKRFPLVGAPISFRYRQLETRLLTDSDAVVVISPAFALVPQMEGVPSAKRFVIPNWAPISEIPAAPKKNEWSVARGLHARPCVVYTGTLGFKHNPATLLAVARGLKELPNACLVVCSEGPAVDWLRKEAAAQGLENLVLEPFQPFEQYPLVLATADILLAILEKEAGEYSVPSKILSYLCAGRPIVASLPMDNLAARTLLAARAGTVHNSDEEATLVASTLRFLQDPAARERAGVSARCYAEKTFDIDRIGKLFADVITCTAGALRPGRRP
jgi:putative colanic acid biosynthesis glycosyltransferase WcaI